MQNSELPADAWRKSRHSVTTNCVEVASAGGYVGVRDTKDRQGPLLRYPAAVWSDFLAAAKAGAFDRP